MELELVIDYINKAYLQYVSLPVNDFYKKEQYPSSINTLWLCLGQKYRILIDCTFDAVAFAR